MNNYRSDIDGAIKKINEYKVRLEMTEETLHEVTEAQKQLNKTLLDTEKARIVVQEVANEIQKNLEYRITNIVSMALASVFNDPYEFKVEFVTRRNQTECDLYFVRGDNMCDPLDSSGGGALDIASLALRMAIWSIKKTRAIQILDEPCKFLSKDMQAKASLMLKELSSKLGIQIIAISHIDDMIEAADRVINITQEKGISKVKVL